MSAAGRPMGAALSAASSGRFAARPAGENRGAAAASAATRAGPPRAGRTARPVGRDLPARAITRVPDLGRPALYAGLPPLGLLRLLRLLLDEPLHLVHELGHVVELPVDRGEADVGDLVEPLE